MLDQAQGSNLDFLTSYPHLTFTFRRERERERDRER